MYILRDAKFGSAVQCSRDGLVDTCQHMALHRSGICPRSILPRFYIPFKSRRIAMSCFHICPLFNIYYDVSFKDPGQFPCLCLVQGWACVVYDVIVSLLFWA